MVAANQAGPKFKLDTELIKVLVLAKASFKTMVGGRPDGFGEQPGKYHSDAIFLMGAIKAKEAFAAFTPREGVDEVWAGKGVISARSGPRAGSARSWRRPSTNP